MKVTFTRLMEEPSLSAQPLPIKDKRHSRMKTDSPVIGFSVGAITGGTGKYQNINGTLTMRWDANICICLFDIVEP